MKLLVMGVILLFIGSSIPALAQTNEHNLPSSRGNWLYVGGSGPGNYTKIQVAIDASVDGDTIFVFEKSSPYFENLFIDKSIKLFGESKDMTSIRAQDYNRSVIEIRGAENVTVTGFNISYFISTPKSIIESRSSFTTISNNTIFDNDSDMLRYECGIYINGTLNNSIINNIFLNIYRGIRIYNSSSFNLVSNNSYFHSNMAIEVGNGTFNCIENNSFVSNSCGIFLADDYNKIAYNYFNSSASGIEVFSSHNLISNNLIENTKFYYGIGLYGIPCEFNTIENNTIRNNPTGIEVSSFCNNTVIRNNRFDNNLCGDLVYGIHTLVTYNSFTNNDYAIRIAEPNNTVFLNDFHHNKIGVWLSDDAYFINITCNNFVRSKGSFLYPFEEREDRHITWDQNYWGPMLRPTKIIFGHLEIVLRSYLYYEIAVRIPWLCSDQNPATEPYDIPTMK